MFPSITFFSYLGQPLNLSGGYHHAQSGCGGGFCVYADIPLAIKSLREQKPDLKVMYVDLDAHQGNGVEECLKSDKDSYILDCFNQANYPRDKTNQQRIDLSILTNEIYCSKHNFMENNPLTCQDCNTAYLTSIKNALPKALQNFQQKYSRKPDIIFYNAGTDCFEEDPLGRMKLSQQGIIDRDQFVFEQARTENIPVCMTLSGGYTKKSAAIIGASIANLHSKKLLDKKA
jgi:histone deacetylase 11